MRRELTSAGPETAVDCLRHADDFDRRSLNVMMEASASFPSHERTNADDDEWPDHSPLWSVASTKDAKVDMAFCNDVFLYAGTLFTHVRWSIVFLEIDGVRFH